MELIKFKEISKYGYKDANDMLVIPAKYEDAKDFKEGYAVVKFKGFYGVINSSDERIIDFFYNSVEEHNLFFECKSIKEHESREVTTWFNRKGIFLHEGKAESLSED